MRERVMDPKMFNMIYRYHAKDLQKELSMYKRTNYNIALTNYEYIIQRPLYRLSIIRNKIQDRIPFIILRFFKHVYIFDIYFLCYSRVFSIT